MGEQLILEPSPIAANVMVIRKAKEGEQAEPRTKKKRVAAYCRVSTDYETQESSLELQMSAYRKTIEGHPDWELAGIFADEGLSGTQAAKRPEFQRMIKYAQQGLIDVIMVKSISRFSRNTKDTLEYTRWLKDIGVSVYFEKEGIDTSALSSEIILSILAAFAQEESRSISENIKKGIRSRYSMGQVPWYTLYGYRKGYVVEEKEAKVVRMLFQLALEGMNPYEIAERMNHEGIPAQGGKKWIPSTINRTLKNEKYKGDVVMQKTYIGNYMTHKVVRNNEGVVEKYYVRKNHQPIVEEEVFDRVQVLLAFHTCKGARQYPFYGILKCPFCERPMVRIGQFGNMAYGVWVCGGKGPSARIGDRTTCPTYMLFDDVLKRSIAQAVASIHLREKKNAAFLQEIKTAKSRGEGITYLDAFKLMDSITTKNYDRLVIRWKMGWTGEYKLLYESQYDAMLPVFDRNNQGEQTIFGMKTIRVKQFINTFEKRQRRIREYLVIDPLPNEAQVPRIERPMKRETNNAGHSDTKQQ